MKLLIEARFEDEVGEAHTFNLAKIERGELRLGNIGMTLDEGRDLLKRAQHTVAALQTHEFVGKYVVCADRGPRLGSCRYCPGGARRVRFWPN